MTVIGHSFGSAVAVDYLADARDLGMPVRLITLASLLELFSKRTPWLDGDIQRLSSRDQPEEWVDVVNRSDWFASGSALPKEGRLRTIEIRSTETMIDKAAARVHARYFGDQQVVRQILRTAE